MGPAVQQLHQWCTVIAQQGARLGIHQHRHGGPVAGRGAAVLIQLQQRFAPLPGWIEGPASSVVIRPCHHEGEAVVQMAQLMHQPGAVGPGAAAPDHQDWPLVCAALEQVFGV